jgi:hypothetical protein
MWEPDSVPPPYIILYITCEWSHLLSVNLDSVGAMVHLSSEFGFCVSHGTFVECSKLSCENSYYLLIQLSFSCVPRWTIFCTYSYYTTNLCGRKHCVYLLRFVSLQSIIILDHFCVGVLYPHNECTVVT